MPFYKRLILRPIINVKAKFYIGIVKIFDTKWRLADRMQNQLDDFAYVSPNFSPATQGNVCRQGSGAVTTHSARENAVIVACGNRPADRGSDHVRSRARQVRCRFAIAVTDPSRRSWAGLANHRRSQTFVADQRSCKRTAANEALGGRSNRSTQHIADSRPR